MHIPAEQSPTFGSSGCTEMAKDVCCHTLLSDNDQEMNSTQGSNVWLNTFFTCLLLFINDL